jgi:hypothetical protein
VMVHGEDLVDLRDQILRYTRSVEANGPGIG